MPTDSPMSDPTDSPMSDFEDQYILKSDSVEICKITDINGQTQYDPVSHPSHYTSGGIECIDAIASAVNGLDGFEGGLVFNTIKYVWRFKHKGKPVQDLEKAAWYLNRLIEYEKKNEA